MGWRTPLFSIVLLSGYLGAFADAADLAETDGLAAQREAFRATYPAVERGQWEIGGDRESLLRSYVLWPDLRAAWLRSTIHNGDHDEIERYLDTHGILKPARELRYRYAIHLAEEGWLGEYLAIYQQFYQGLEIAKLDCLALQAEIDAGREDRIVSRALDLWLVGKSQADECDPVFAHLRQRDILTRDQYAARYDLAIEERQFGLARYLSKPLGAAFRDEASAWLDAQNKPLAFIGRASVEEDTETVRSMLAYAVRRLAYDDPLEARRHWQRLNRRFSFDDVARFELDRHIALWAARLHLPEAVDLLTDLPTAAANVESGRWLVRSNLLRHRWSEVIRAVDALPAEESRRAEWQYWKAVALEKLGDSESAALLFEDLSAERSYYGFLAADALQLPYSMGSESLSVDPTIVDALQALPALVRARELFYVGLEGRGRSEWDAAINQLSDREQRQAALLAHQWGWHSRAISSVAAAGAYDDLQIRYPLPWRGEFEQHAGSAGIEFSWAYGVARSESLFMRDIRSSAGAIGVMQLMPETGRQAAREISLPYAGLATLTNSTSNIRLGTYYLGKMYSRFGDNRVLATAAYNAGPFRVQNWLPDSGSLDARIWIENIPFNETRGYVRRVLTDEVIFHWRLTGRLRRISSELPQIVAAATRAGSNQSP